MIGALHVDIVCIPRILGTTEIKLEISPEFSEFAFHFFQDLDIETHNEEEMFEFVLSAFKGEKAHRLRMFIETLIRDSVSDEELQKLWRKTKADVVFENGSGVRAMLKEASRRLASR
jgi:hypothetical protein